MATKLDFANWLKEQMRLRGFTQATLAKQSGITAAALSRVLNQERYPGVAMCQGIARAFDLRDHDVMKVAGLLKSEQTGLTPAASEMADLFTALNADDQQELLLLARLKVKQQVGRRWPAAADLTDLARTRQAPKPHFYANAPSEDDLDASLMDWFHELPTPYIRDHAYRLIQNVIPTILHESGEAVELPEPRPELPPGSVGYEIKKRKKSKPVK